MRYVLRILFSEHINMVKKGTKKIRKKKEVIEAEEIENNEDDENNEQSIKAASSAEKTKNMLKKKINEWLDHDDKIKELSSVIKEHRKQKKEDEDSIIKLINVLGMEEKKIDVVDDNNKFRSRVYKHKSVTKGPLKSDNIRDALMEIVKTESRVDQLMNKIESRRPINEKYYLKRMRSSKDE